jgi:tRNA (guanine-N7-)-methyltransferase
VGLTPEFLAHVTQRRTDLRAEVLSFLPASGSIILEIGSGHGHFLERYAAEFPEKLCVGVDIRGERIERARRKRRRANLSNCFFMRAEAREFLQALPETVTCAEIWVLFPDPWPKKRHHKHRILRREFLEEVAPRVKKGGRLFFRTDYADYFHAVATVLAASETWQLDPAAHWPLEHPTVFQQRALSYHSLVAVRTSHRARPAETIVPTRPSRADPT